MDYYRGNALYDYISSTGTQRFKFVSGNMWQLIYGDDKCNPKLLALVVGVDKFEPDSLPTEVEEPFLLLKSLGDKCGIPTKIICFDSSEPSVENVWVYEDAESEAKEVSMAELTDIFGSVGLPTSNSSTAKYLNDRTSSAYHKWQRASLGRSLTVSDIDLWKLDEDGNPHSIYELKRSFYGLDRWQPFRDDYRNFQLVSNLANCSEVGFQIVYNVRHKNPFRDDVSKLKLFEVNFSLNPTIKYMGIVPKEGFIDV